MNRADLLLSVLRDGKPHTRQDIFGRVGYFLANNAASELRARGFDVVHSREGRLDVYRLVGSLTDGGDAAAGNESATPRGLPSFLSPPSVNVSQAGGSLVGGAAGGSTDEPSQLLREAVTDSDWPAALPTNDSQVGSLTERGSREAIPPGNGGGSLPNIGSPQTGLLAPRSVSDSQVGVAATPPSLTTAVGAVSAVAYPAATPAQLELSLA